MKLVIHSNKTFWGHVWHIITDDGHGHVAASIENNKKNTIFLYGLSVIPTSRNKGIGKELIKAVEDIGKENDKHRCILSIEKPKSWLYDFYINLGYEYKKEDKEYIYLIKKI